MFVSTLPDPTCNSEKSVNGGNKQILLLLLLLLLLKKNSRFDFSLKGICLELSDSNHNVNCEKSFCELFLGKISIEVTLISQVTSACQSLKNTIRRSAIFM